MKNKKSLGQHWLYNRAILDNIAQLAVEDDVATCIEIGPGLGTLTASLLKFFPQVIAIEYDKALSANLPKSFPGKNLTVINDDILEVDLASLAQNTNYCIAGNIPYYITSPIIQKVLNLSHPPQKIVLLVQKEVAERIVAHSGKYSLLALQTQNLAQVHLGSIVKATDFTPPPKVDSQVLILTPLAKPQIPIECFTLVKRGFSSPRKKLIGNLAGYPFSRDKWREIFLQQGLDSNVRAEDLTLQAWQQLYRTTDSCAPRQN